VNALAMDASTSIVSCSLSWEGGWSQSSSRSAVGHAERLMPMIDALLSGAGVAPSSLGLVVCASGPGSFTGLALGGARSRSGETAGPGEGPFYVRNDEEDIGITFPGRKK